MYVNIRRSVECVNFEEVEPGNLFVSNDNAYIKFNDDSAYSGVYNAVNLETGVLICFDPNAPVVVPDVVELTVDL
jgi:hypothetical protein